MTKKPAGFAPIPHALVLNHPAPHVRLWGLLHYYDWQRMHYDIADLMTKLGATDRSIYRWLDDLHAAGWITFEAERGNRRQRRSLEERITLHVDTVQRESQVSDPDVGNLPKLLTPESQVSDPDVGNLMILPRPNAVKNAPQTPDQTPDSDPPPDPTTTPQTPTTPTPQGGGGGEKPSVVKALPTEQPKPWTQTPRTAQPEAEPNATTAVLNRPSPPPTPVAGGPFPLPTRTPSRAAEASESTQLLHDAGFLSVGVREFSHYPPDVLAADIAAMRHEGTQPGGMVMHWRIFPPGTTNWAVRATARSQQEASHDPIRPRPVGSRGRRVPLAAQPAPDHTERPESDLADLLAYEDAVIAERLEQQRGR